MNNHNELVTKNLIPVSVAAVADRVIFHPIETVITARQDKGERIPQIIRGMFSKGIKTFYPGYLPSIISSIPIRMSIYSTYLIVKEYGEKNTALSAMNIMLAGGVLSGIAEALILCPSESYRTRQILNVTVKNQLHPRILYSGFLPLVFRTSLENSICLIGSDLLIERMSDEQKKSHYTPYVTGLISGAASQVIGGPIDVLKTRVMKTVGQNIGIVENAKALLNEQGFFRSVGLRALRAGICNSMMLGTTAVVQKLMKNLDEPCTQDSRHAPLFKR